MKTPKTLPWNAEPPAHAEPHRTLPLRVQQQTPLAQRQQPPADEAHHAPHTDRDLKEVGLKATLPRMKVLEIIRSSPSRHLSAEDVYRRLVEQRADVGLATVYRVLSQLEGAGLLTRNVFDGGRAFFEIDEGGHHDHLICLTCGRVDEFTNDAIEALQQQVAQVQGYELADHRLSLYGHCPACVGARTSAPEAGKPPR